MLWCKSVLPITWKAEEGDHLPVLLRKFKAICEQLN